MSTMARISMPGSTVKPVVRPYTILIDAQEKHPWTFQGICADADQGYRPIQVATEVASLGKGRGDYTIRDDKSEVPLQQKISLERKSLDDFHGTLLGWNDNRRARFERELETLSEYEFAAVIVEASLIDCLMTAPEWGKKTAADNAKILHRTVLSWQRRYPVHWIFCNSRREAEITAFRHLDGFWKDWREKCRRAKKTQSTLP